MLAKGKRHWVFAYLIAKKDRANIDDDVLADFKKLARAYACKIGPELVSTLSRGDLLELCDDE